MPHRQVADIDVDSHWLVDGGPPLVQIDVLGAACGPPKGKESAVSAYCMRSRSENQPCKPHLGVGLGVCSRLGYRSFLCAGAAHRPKKMQSTTRCRCPRANSTGGRQRRQSQPVAPEPQALSRTGRTDIRYDERVAFNGMHPSTVFGLTVRPAVDRPSPSISFGALTHHVAQPGAGGVILAALMPDSAHRHRRNRDACRERQHTQTERTGIQSR